jgi:hypothetical protein
MTILLILDFASMPAILNFKEFLQARRKYIHIEFILHLEEKNFEILIS